MPPITQSTPVIMWFRQDLRLADNPALNHAASLGKPVLPIFILDEVSPECRAMGAAQKWWLHHSLVSLSDDLKRLGVPLTLLRGAATDVIDALCQETGADSICWNRRYGAGEQAVDATIKSTFRGTAKSFGGHLLHEPSLVRTGTDMPYRVYTPFWKKFCAMGPPRQPVSAPKTLTPCVTLPTGDALDDWKLLPRKPDWSPSLAQAWTPGEAGAHQRRNAFLADNLRAYDTARDLPGPDRTSRLSPHLRFGEISPYQLWHDAFDTRHTAEGKAREIWAKELVWREFAYHLLQEYPHLDESNFNGKFDTFPWQSNPQALSAWQKGQTGYPIIDAGMRQLYQTGWMHNRVRMIVGSFLVKHLLIDWREGEKWFWDTLVDGDPASNPAQWQWVAGTGADAAPYFRIFNPIMQAQKFDTDGSYIHKYVPELKNLPAQHLPAPWEAPESVLRQAGVELGKTYPKPIVDHKQARARALEALNQSKDAIAP